MEYFIFHLMKILLVLTMFIELNFQELKLYDKRKCSLTIY